MIDATTLRQNSPIDRRGRSERLDPLDGGELDTTLKLEQHVLFRGEVEVERAAREARLLGDPIDLGVVESDAPKLRNGGLVETLARLEALPFSPVQPVRRGDSGTLDVRYGHTVLSVRSAYATRRSSRLRGPRIMYESTFSIVSNWQRTCGSSSTSASSEIRASRRASEAPRQK